jgi:hypothetical protein
MCVFDNWLQLFANTRSEDIEKADTEKKVDKKATETQNERKNESKE